MVQVEVKTTRVLHDDVNLLATMDSDSGFGWRQQPTTTKDNAALNNYKAQLALLEQQNKKRLKLLANV